jgi:rare lipoprotein A
MIGVNFGMTFVRIAALAAVLGLSAGFWPNTADAAQTGMASYYKHGKRTANGESFDPHGMTAAHRTFPFGTRVLVTNLKNGKSVIVRINDRGPFTKGRVIDLSLGAAKVVGLTQSGVAKVKVVRLD